MLLRPFRFFVCTALLLPGCLLPEVEWSNTLSTGDAGGADAGTLVGSLQPEPGASPTYSTPPSRVGTTPEPAPSGGAYSNSPSSEGEIPVGSAPLPLDPVDEGEGSGTCSDGVKNGAEVGVDCGGGCGLCEIGSECQRKEECVSGVCNSKACDPAFEKCCQPASSCRGRQVCEPGEQRCKKTKLEVCNACGTGFEFMSDCLACTLSGTEALCSLPL